METINIKIIHPTNNSDIDIGCSGNILIRDIFSQLVEANFLIDGQPYIGVLKSRDGHKESTPLDNEKTILENDIRNNDVVLTVISTETNEHHSEDKKVICVENRASVANQKIVIIDTMHGNINLWDMWQTVYPYLDQLGTILGIAGSAIGLGIWIKKKFSQSYSPSKFVALITNKELWNAYELALILDISDVEAKSLLKGFGYKWDRKFSLYVKPTEQSR